MNGEKTPEKISSTPWEIEKSLDEDGKYWLKMIQRDQEGRIIAYREREFIDPKNPEKGVKYDYEKSFTYNQNGELIKEKGKDYLKGNQWEKEFSWQEGKMISEHGLIVEGPDKGHEWQITFRRDEQGNVLEEEGEILEQGVNPQKPERGHSWRKEHLYDEKGNWRGAIGIITGGKEKGKIWTEGSVTEGEIEKFLAKERK